MPCAMSGTGPTHRGSRAHDSCSGGREAVGSAGTDAVAKANREILRICGWSTLVWSQHHRRWRWDLAENRLPPVSRSQPSSKWLCNLRISPQYGQFFLCVIIAKSSCMVARANEDRERPSFQEMESLGKALGSHSATRAIMV